MKKYLSTFILSILAYLLLRNMNLSIASILMIAYIIMIVHEIGHIIIANLYDIEVTKLCIGSGKKILDSKYLIVRLLPIEMAVLHKELPPNKYIQLLFFLGGFFSQLCITIVVLVLYVVTYNSLFLSINTINIIIFAYNILPVSGNDGDMIYKILSS